MNKQIICVFSGLICMAQAQDPTQPEWPALAAPAATAAEKAGKPALRLQLIRQQGKRQLAVINGQSLTVGQTIAGYQLVRIQSDHVTLQNEQEQLVLPLFVTTRR